MAVNFASLRCLCILGQAGAHTVSHLAIGFQGSFAIAVHRQACFAGISSCLCASIAVHEPGEVLALNELIFNPCQEELATRMLMRLLSMCAGQRQGWAVIGAVWVVCRCKLLPLSAHKGLWEFCFWRPGSNGCACFAWAGELRFALAIDCGHDACCLIRLCAARMFHPS